MKKSVKIILIVLLILLIALFLIRLINPREIDDISPEIPCEDSLIEKSDILWVIPIYNNKPISENKEWCSYILSLNKTLGLHGVYHTYEEFLNQEISQEQLNLAISEFEKCFNQTPLIFKPPQLKINKKNRELIRKNNLILRSKFSQTMHKVYHCNDTGTLGNKFIGVF